MIAGGVTLSVIVSPVVAAVTVGKKKCSSLFYLMALSVLPFVSRLHFKYLKELNGFIGVCHT